MLIYYTYVRAKRISKKIRDLTKKIATYNNPEKIILFGSYAWGKPGLDSDIDICVIEHGISDRRERQLRLRKLLFGAGLPVDVLSYTPEEIKKRLSCGDFFVKNILSKGASLYERKENT